MATARKTRTAYDAQAAYDRAAAARESDRLDPWPGEFDEPHTLEEVR